MCGIVGVSGVEDAAIRATSGSANAIVLPLPVRPRPSTSRPARESGSVSRWMGKASVLPEELRMSASTAGTPRARKVVMEVLS